MLVVSPPTSEDALILVQLYLDNLDGAWAEFTQDDKDTSLRQLVSECGFPYCCTLLASCPAAFDVQNRLLDALLIHIGSIADDDQRIAAITSIQDSNIALNLIKCAKYPGFAVLLSSNRLSTLVTTVGMSREGLIGLLTNGFQATLLNAIVTSTQLSNFTSELDHYFWTDKASDLIDVYFALASSVKSNEEAPHELPFVCPDFGRWVADLTTAAAAVAEGGHVIDNLRMRIALWRDMMKFIKFAGVCANAGICSVTDGLIVSGCLPAVMSLMCLDVVGKTRSHDEAVIIREGCELLVKTLSGIGESKSLPTPVLHLWLRTAFEVVVARTTVAGWDSIKDVNLLLSLAYIGYRDATDEDRLLWKAVLNGDVYTTLSSVCMLALHDAWTSDSQNGNQCAHCAWRHLDVWLSSEGCSTAKLDWDAEFVTRFAVLRDHRFPKPSWDISVSCAILVPRL